MGTDITATYGGLGKASFVFMDPSIVLIVGLDVPIPKDPEDPLYRLIDPNPERMKLPTDDLEASMSRFGWFKSSAVEIVKVGDRVFANNGRRRTRAARAVNKKLIEAGSEALIRMTCIPAGTSTDLAITAVGLNAGALVDGPLGRAQIVKRLETLNHDDESIMAALGGISKNTLDNLRALLNLAPDIAKEISAGTLAPTMGYELGKIKEHKAQREALAKVRTETGTEKVQGAEGRKRIQAAGAGRKVQVSKAWNKGQTTAARAVFEPTAKEPHETRDQALVFAVLGVLLGEDDSKGLASLNEYPSVQKHLVKIARSGAAEASK